MFQVVNPPGQRQDKITASDKEWNEVITDIIYTATIFSWNNCGEEALAKEKKEKVDQVVEMLIQGEFEDAPPEKMSLMDATFGLNSVLKREDF